MKTHRNLPSFVAFALPLVLAGCAAGSGGPETPGPVPGDPEAAAGEPVADVEPPPFSAPPEIRWSRTAAEHRVIYETTYARATDAVWGAASVVEGPWGVIVDADETVLDNSLYQLERARQGLGYTAESWNAWVRREAATALPGARDFLRQVRELGGYVAVVTNRDDAVCEATRRNLTALDVPWDVVLCRPSGVSEKETRFEMVQEGTTPAGLPPSRWWRGWATTSRTSPGVPRPSATPMRTGSWPTSAPGSSSCPTPCTGPGRTTR